MTLLSHGYQQGDVIAVCLPLTAPALTAYLAILLVGATAVSIAESFSAEEIATRLEISGAKAIITQVGGCQVGRVGRSSLGG